MCMHMQLSKDSRPHATMFLRMSSFTFFRVTSVKERPKCDGGQVVAPICCKFDAPTKKELKGSYPFLVNSIDSPPAGDQASGVKSARSTPAYRLFRT